MILDDIVERKRLEVEASSRRYPLSLIEADLPHLPPPRDFLSAVEPRGRVKVIAEIKRASPSKGVIRENFNPTELAITLERAGASALSVLTDESFFKGSLCYLKDVRAVTGIPVLRKDFIITPYQVYEARLYGADAVLLIASCLDVGLLDELVGLVRSLGMEALVEVHNERELDAALSAGARIVGINNRDLQTFSVDMGVSVRLSRLVPEDKVVVCESGVTQANIGEMKRHGLFVFLIGESLMRAEDPGKELEAFLGS
jgi:indole-3-glycerol phosphate synthase